MANRFTQGAKSIAECDVCGFRYRLKELKALVVKTKMINVLACRTCWSPDHPQLQLGYYPVSDPQAVRNPRPDFAGYVENRDIQWGWNPVGGSSFFDSVLTPNNLVTQTFVGQVTTDDVLICPVYEITTNTTTAGPVRIPTGCFANISDAAVWTIT